MPRPYGTPRSGALPRRDLRTRRRTMRAWRCLRVTGGSPLVGEVDAHRGEELRAQADGRGPARARAPPRSPTSRTSSTSRSWPSCSGAWAATSGTTSPSSHGPHRPCPSEPDHRADYDLVRRMRASICVLGPLVARVRGGRRRPARRRQHRLPRTRHARRRPAAHGRPRHERARLPASRRRRTACSGARIVAGLPERRRHRDHPHGRGPGARRDASSTTPRASRRSSTSA